MVHDNLKIQMSEPQLHRKQIGLHAGLRIFGCFSMVTSVGRFIPQMIAIALSWQMTGIWASTCAQSSRFDEFLDGYAVLRAAVSEQGSVVSRERLSVTTEDGFQGNSYRRYVWSENMNRYRVDSRTESDAGQVRLSHRLSFKNKRLRSDGLQQNGLIFELKDTEAAVGVPFKQDFFAFLFHGSLGWEEGSFLENDIGKKLTVLDVSVDNPKDFRVLVLQTGARAVFDIQCTRVGQFMVPVVFKSRTPPNNQNGPSLSAQSINVNDAKKWHAFIVQEFEWIEKDDLVVPVRFTSWSDRYGKNVDEEFEVVFADWKLRDSTDLSPLEVNDFNEKELSKVNFAEIAGHVDKVIESRLRIKK